MHTIIVGLIAAILFTIIALFEIWSSKQILVAEKPMWTTGFIVISGLTGLLYFLLQEKESFGFLGHYHNIMMLLTEVFRPSTLIRTRGLCRAYTFACKRKSIAKN